MVQPDHIGWPTETRYLKAACEAFGFGFRDVSGDGYLVEITDGRKTIALGAGRACIYPTNSAAAVAIGRDKMHTTHLLEAHGLATFGGALFFVNDHHRKYRGPGREISDALVHGRERGFPLFVKPNVGARGDLAEIVHDELRLTSYLQEAAGRYDSVVIQEVFEGTEYRVICLAGEALVGVQRANGELAGDGRSSLRELIRGYNASLAGSGVSGLAPETAGWIANESGLELDQPVPAGRWIALPGRRNLTAVGRAERLIDPVPQRLAETALAATRVTGLHLAGVDLMEISKPGRESSLRVIEVNGAPGLTALEQLDRFDLVLEIWRRIFSVAFDADRGN